MIDTKLTPRHACMVNADVSQRHHRLYMTAHQGHATHPLQMVRDGGAVSVSTHGTKAP
jgi:hypothetical protein